MADSVQIAATEEEKNPQRILLEREIAYHRGEKALYIGIGGQRVKLCQADDIAKLEGKLTAEQVDSMDGLSSGATLAQVVEKYNDLISALKESGIMKN